MRGLPGQGDPLFPHGRLDSDVGHAHNSVKDRARSVSISEGSRA